MSAEGSASREDDDAALVRAAASGDEAAFERIVRRHSSLVLGLGVRLLGDRADAEDLFQDVFVRVHRALPHFRGDSSLKTWIAQVTVNAARNRHRSNRRRFRHRTRSLDAPATPDGVAPAEVLPDPRPGPDRHARGREDAARLEEALAQLQPEYREAILLREVEGLSYAEIARATDVAQGTVKSRISRARARLVELLA